MKGFLLVKQCKITIFTLLLKLKTEKWFLSYAFQQNFSINPIFVLWIIIQQNSPFYHPTIRKTNSIKIWILVLGEDKQIHLKNIYEEVTPMETCIILPFPSKDPRRGDNIFLQYEDFFREKIDYRDVKRHIIYASERNPFDVSRKIINTAKRFDETMRIIDGCQFVLSALSNKISSIGVLLACYDLRKNNFDIGIAYTEAMGYLINDDFLRDELPILESELFSFWIEGECYYEKRE